MNVNLIYQNNSFNFDLRKEVTINYLEDLASKLISKDKSSFELLYKDSSLSEKKNSLLKDIVKTETASIKIFPKVCDYKKKSVRKLPKLKLSNNSNDLDIKNNLLLNETEISQSFSEISNKPLNNLSKYIYRSQNKIKKPEYSTENKVFEEIYNAKDNELLSLMKNLSQKIKEYDDALYKKYKTNLNRANSGLLIFEKNIINFKDKQIKFFKKLINFFDTNKDNDFTVGIKELDEFYKELDEYNNKTIINEYQNKIEKLEKQLITPVNLSEKNANSNKELPLLINNNLKNTNKLLLSEKKPINSLNINKIEKKENVPKEEKKENIPKEEKKEKSLFFSPAKKNKLKSIPERNNQDNLYPTNSNNKQNISKTIDMNDKKNNIDCLKSNSIDNTTKANVNQSENSILSKSKEKSISVPKKLSINNIFSKKQNIKKNKEEDNYSKEKSNREKKPLDLNIKYNKANTIQNIKTNQNKVSTLFEISESFAKENKDSEKYNSCEYESSKDKANSQEELQTENNNIYNNDNMKLLKLNLKKKNSINYTLIKNSKIGYLVKAKNNRVINRLKKLGNNPNDFLI